jgi:hypothetical protein
LSNPFFLQTVTIAIAIAIAVHPDDQWRHVLPALSAPQQPAVAAAAAASLDNPKNVWRWLRANHPRQLVLLNIFEVELRLG